MRTTIRLPEDLLAEAKHLAARTGRTLTAVIEDALREVLARAEGRVQSPPFRLPTFSGGGPLPGVDLDDSAALLDVMEGLD
jgi:hypothetical protein